MLEKFLPRADFGSYEDFKQNFDITVPEHFNFAYDVVDEWARVDPDKRALVWCDDHGGERTLTFSDVSRMSSQIAGAFRAGGIQKGDVVMLLLRRRWEYWPVCCAINKLGAVVVPSSIQLTAKDIKYRIEAANVRMIVALEDDFVVSQVDMALGEMPDADILRVLVPCGSDAVQQKREGWTELHSMMGAYPETIEHVVTDVDDLFLIYFTSGTTGMPKMVRHVFSHPLGHIITAKYWQRVKENGLHMSVSDSGWAKFGWGKIFGQWICGCAVFGYDMDKFEALTLLDKMQKYRLTSFCAPPTMYRFMLQEDISRFDLSSIEHCCNAGEPLSPDVYRTFYEATGLLLTEGFGQSESPVLIANFEWFTPRPGSMGKPSPLFDLRLEAADGRECDNGEEGEIVILARKNPDKPGEYIWPTGLFRGYYKDEAYTARVMSGGVYRTGDVAWRDDDGYHWFVGRNDDVIKCSGYRIGPFEVESALLEHPSVLECAVTAAPDPVRGQVVKATIVLKPGYEASDELTADLQRHVKKVTAPYKYPRIVQYVAELPKTVSGKIRRAELRRQSEDCLT